jgi:arabinogalactan endo-1,4-beta-galactosidase
MPSCNLTFWLRLLFYLILGMLKNILLLLVLSSLLSCKKSTVGLITQPEELNPKILAIKGIDASFLPELRQSNIVLKNALGIAEDMLVTLKNSGVNTVRIRLWKNPSTIHSSLAEVKLLAQEITNAGLKVWLCVHYSDTWADPGYQQKPAQWNTATLAQLKDSIYQYTKKIVTEINPAYIQIGNEINNGFCWPEGKYANQTQFIDMVAQGAKAVRDNAPNTKIMLHFAGHENAAAFFSLFANVPYDIIGLSYYPIWHGKSIDALQTNLNALGTQFNKDIVIAETSYPFTFGYNDYTNNIIGSANQILPEYAATPTGQLQYLQKIKSTILAAPKGIGFCYWGGDWVAMYGATATNGSSYENQALWDFNNTALPVLSAFKD